MDNKKLNSVIKEITSKIKVCDVNNFEELLKDYISNSNLFDIVNLDVGDGDNGELHQTKSVIKNRDNFPPGFKNVDEFLEFIIKINIDEYFREINHDFITHLSFNCSDNSDKIFGEIPVVNFDENDVKSLFRFMSNISQDMVMVISGDKAINNFYRYSRELNILLDYDHIDNLGNITYGGNYKNFNIYNHYNTTDNEILIYPKEELSFIFDRMITDIIIENDDNLKIIKILGEYKFVSENINDFVKFNVI